jgi:hypothetical protein
VWIDTVVGGVGEEETRKQFRAEIPIFQFAEMWIRRIEQFSSLLPRPFNAQFRTSDGAGESCGNFCVFRLNESDKKLKSFVAAREIMNEARWGEGESERKSFTH